jgi:hypothetical protein
MDAAHIRVLVSDMNVTAADVFDLVVSGRIQLVAEVCENIAACLM